ncbi:MAG: hypothetical protein Q9221_006918 [Calogaya cf. arnoldii]
MESRRQFRDLRERDASGASPTTGSCSSSSTPIAGVICSLGLIFQEPLGVRVTSQHVLDENSNLETTRSPQILIYMSLAPRLLSLCKASKETEEPANDDANDTAMARVRNPSATEQEIEQFRPGWRLHCACAAIAIVNLACALDATIVAVALPVITVALHGDAITAFWAGTSFLLTSTVWQPSFVAFSRNWGRRPLLLLAVTLFTVGSIVCAVSRNFTMMLVGRSIQGTGAGGILALTQILITDLIPLRERGRYFALFNIVWAIGSVSGPLIGGALASANAWRWIFYLNLPIVAIGFAGILAFLELENTRRTLEEKLLEIDYIGSVIFLPSTTSFLVGITWGGVQYAWDSWRTITPIVVGLSGLVLFIYWEARFAKFPVLPLDIFKNADTNIAYFIDLIHGIIMWGVVYYMPLFFEGGKDLSPVLAGVLALPLSLTVVPCGMAVGIVAAKTGHYRWAVWTGWVVITIGSGLLYLLTPTITYPAAAFLLLFAGIGLGLVFPAISLAVQASVAQKNVAVAAALTAFFRCFGQTIGVAMGGVVFQNRMMANLASHPELSSSATLYSLDVVALIHQINIMSGSDPRKRMLAQALSRSIGTIWAVMSGLAGLALISTIFLKGYSLNQALVTEQRFNGQSSNKNIEEG